MLDNQLNLPFSKPYNCTHGDMCSLLSITVFFNMNGKNEENELFCINEHFPIKEKGMKILLLSTLSGPMPT